MGLISFKLLSSTFHFEINAHHLHSLVLQTFSYSILTIIPLSPFLCLHGSASMERNSAGKKKGSGEERD